MSLEIMVTSENIGSNPGGKCRIIENGGFSGYFKYCLGRKSMAGSSFVPEHQPIYEALTFELAKSLGLSTSDYYVISNKKRDVKFSGWNDFLKHDPSGRDFYFVSKLLSKPEVELSQKEEAMIIDFELPYLESVMISDIVGRRQNYFTYGGQNPEIVYLDLGHSFVHASGGNLQLPHRLEDSSKRGLKNRLKKLGKHAILTSSQIPINLRHIVLDVRGLHVKALNPRSRIPISKVLSGDEITEIEMYLSESLLKSLPGFKERGLLL